MTIQAQAYDAAGAEFLEAFVRAGERIKQRQEAVCAELAAIGVYHVVPGDGWVDRDKDGMAYHLRPANPYRWRGTPAIGDTVAVVSVYDSTYRLYRITKEYRYLLGSPSYDVEVLGNN